MGGVEGGENAGKKSSFPLPMMQALELQQAFIEYREIFLGLTLGQPFLWINWAFAQKPGKEESTRFAFSMGIRRAVIPTQVYPCGKMQGVP